MSKQKYDKFSKPVAAPAVVTNKKMPRVLVIGNDAYAKPVRTMLYKRGYEYTSTINNAEYHMAFFLGGHDVSPFLYGEKRLKDTYCDPDRDMDELKLFHSLGGDDPYFPKVGICRGAQFLNVMSGGSLWQDVNGHYANKGVLVHDMFDVTKEATKKYNGPRRIQTTSTHHQMMIPGPMGDVICKSFLSTVKRNDAKTISIDRPLNGEGDAEVVYYWHTGCLCVQGHPEYDQSPEFTDYFFELLEDTYDYTYKQLRGEIVKKEAAA